LQLLQKVYCKMVKQNKTIHKDDKEKQTLELGQLKKNHLKKLKTNSLKNQF